MSWHQALEATCAAAGCDPVDLVIAPKPRDIGGFEVRRALPAPERRAVGPFVFFDQMGPAEFPAGQGLDVRPHPHIGLSTLTWLIEGEIMHRDSLGTAQRIRPGEVNWMTAGRGIVHSERTPTDRRAGSHRLSGLQTWLALPAVREEVEPSFRHFSADALPVIEAEGSRLTLVAGTGWGARSPVEVFFDAVYADAELDAGAWLSIPPEHEERACYVLQGAVGIAGARFQAGTMLVLKPDLAVTVDAETAARLIVLGGAPLDGPRQLWWNFVSSRTERIEQAKRDWREGRFGKIAGDPERIPLPE